MKNIQCYIFDLDGTLYDFGGKKFSDSRLGITLRENYISLISENDIKDARQMYENMCTIEKATGVGISLQLSEKIGKTRPEVLQATWGSIELEDIVKSYKYSEFLLPRLSTRKRRLFLVTAAPRAWAYRVLNYMNLSRYFESIFGLEDFGASKKEVFQKISLETGIDPRLIISVGDQEHSDIIPAQELGMQTLLIQEQDDILKLLKF